MRETPMKRMNLIAAVLIASLLGGCQTLDPYTGQQKTSNTAKGAGIGAVAGGVAGALINKKDRGKGAAIGALLGAGVGGGIGYYMDQQEAELRRILAGSGVSVTRIGDRIILNMPGNITFDSDRSEIKTSFYNVLNAVGLVLTKFDKTAVRVAGHTDSTGSKEHNYALSERRAYSVTNYLYGRGVVSGRIQSVGYGEDSPIADNGTTHGRSLNRRVEIEILPPAQG
jgi:outer membrane protein OmpA-like peptidoglycan-associated protein